MAPMIDPNGTHTASVDFRGPFVEFIANSLDSIAESEILDVKSASNGSDDSTRGIKRPAELNGNAPQQTEELVGIAKFDGPRETRSFPCVVHTRSSAFPHVKGALPFPDEMTQLIAWTDAFVERLGWQALQQHEVGSDSTLP